MIEIKKVKYLPELRRVAELADEIWHECFTDIISAGQIDYMVGKFQSLEAMCRQVEEQSYSYLAVYDDGDLCGYIGVKPEQDERFFLSNTARLEKGKYQMTIVEILRYVALCLIAHGGICRICNGVSRFQSFFRMILRLRT